MAGFWLPGWTFECFPATVSSGMGGIDARAGHRNPERECVTVNNMALANLNNFTYILLSSPSLGLPLSYMIFFSPLHN